MVEVRITSQFVTAPERCIHPPHDPVDPAETFIRGNILCLTQLSICHCLSTGALGLCRLDVVRHKRIFLPGWFTSGL